MKDPTKDCLAVDDRGHECIRLEGQLPHRTADGYEWGEDEELEPQPYAEPGGDRCRVRVGLYTCNAAPGHPGNHTAWGFGGDLLCHVWPQDEEPVSAADAIARLNPSAREVAESHRAAKAAKFADEMFGGQS